jgi:hypothetical protein
LGVLLGLLAASAAWAHSLNSCYLTATVGANAIRLRALWSFHASSSEQAEKPPVITPQRLQAALQNTAQFSRNHIHLLIDQKPVALQLHATGIEYDAAGQEYLAIDLVAPIRAAPESIGVSLQPSLFESFGQTFSVLLKVEAAGRTQQAVLSIGEPSQTFHINTPRPLWDQLADYFHLGIEHIFLGYDHLMFLAALIVIGGQLASLIKIVTAFTVAHSLTLVAAALGWVALPSRLVESAVALSIAYVAAENLLVREPAHRWRLTFAFGLVHGFGFATVLRELGLPTRGLASSLLAFNVGVEAGQVAIVLALLPLVRWLTGKPFHRAVVATSSCIVLAFGLGWLIERVFGLAFMPI